MTALGISAALALVIVLVALAASLIALQRLRGKLHALTRHARDEAGWQTVARDDLQALRDIFDRMNARVEAQQATLDQAFEIAGLGTWAILPDLNSVRASLHIRKILGFSEEDEDVQLDALRDRIVPEDRDAFAAALKRATDDRVMTDLEFRAVDAKGEDRVFRARTGPDGAEPRAPEQGVSGIIQDITDLRQKELALTRSQMLERLAGETAQVGGWRYDVATRTFTGSRETARIVGLEDGWHSSVEDAMDRLIPGEDRARLERSFWTCVGTGTRFDEIAKFRKFDGGETWLRVIGEAERDASGKIIATYGATQDMLELISTRAAADDVRVLLQTILDDLSDGFIIHDRDGAIRYINRRAHSILNVSDRDVIGGNIWQDLPWVGGSPFERMLRKAIETGESQSMEGEIATPDQWVNVMVHPTKAVVAIYLNDITEERQARTRLRLLDAAMKEVSDVVLITDAQSLDRPGPPVVYVNEAFVAMTGYSPEEILGKSLRILQGPETERERLREIRLAMEAHEPVRVELTNYHKNGKSFVVEIDINPLFDAAGTCTHYVSVQRDMTERREREQHLRLREEQFRLASMASQDIIWDWDLHTGLLWNSSGSSSIFGPVIEWDLENILEGRIENALERIHADDRLNITESLDAALSGDAQSWRCEYRVKAKDGSWRNISDKAFIVRDKDGTPRRMVGAMSDITDLRALDAQLHQAQKLETVGQLTGGIAHDFNNLLTIILGNCDILLEDIGEDSELRPLLQSIEDAAERGAGVSGDLLAFSRLQPLAPRPTDINDLIERASGLFERAIDASVTLRYALEAAPSIACVDPDKLQAALLNLVLNAVAAISDEGTITIRTRVITMKGDEGPAHCQPGDYVAIEVTDDGMGMSPEVSQRAFEPFFTTKESGVGTGMGLSSVYGMVKQSGGHVTIDSEQGRGTTVTLSLPAADEADAAEPPAIPQVTTHGGGHRILVVEDDAELRAFMRKVLSRQGYRIIEAETGAAAVEVLQDNDDFDLVLTDVVMPGGVNGVQLARKAQEMHPGLRILFTSGYAQDALPKERHVPSDIPMLPKPFRTSELCQMVRETLANPVILSS